MSPQGDDGLGEPHIIHEMIANLPASLLQSEFQLSQPQQWNLYNQFDIVPEQLAPKKKSLGKRPKEELIDDKKELVFKGFTLEPDSKRIKFINNEKKAEGINDGPWTDKEHEDFLLGLEVLGAGKWKDIADRYVKSRSRVQVASHAQKYFKKLKKEAL